MGKDKLKKNGGKGTAVGNALRFLAKQGKTIAPSLLDLAGSVTGMQDLKNLGDEIRGNTILNDEDKELLLKELEYDMVEMQEVTKRWTSDNMSDNYMSKNIRPLTLGFLTATLFIYIILDSSLKGFEIDSEWVSLLKGLMMLVYGGYFGARTAEKIFKK